MVRRVVVAGLLLACGCNQLFGLEAPGDDDDPPADGGTDGSIGEWADIAKVGIAALLEVTEEDPAITPDGRQLYFAASVTGGFKDLWVSNLVSGDTWETATLSPLSHPAIDGSPRFRDPESDGIVEVYLSSDRMGSPLDIFTAARIGSQAWTNPAKVDALSAPEEDSAAAPCDELGRFVVASTRGGASSDLYEIVVDGTVAYIDEVNTGSQETGPFLSRDCKRLYYASNSLGTYDLYVVERPAVDQPWGNPAVISELSTGAQEGDPWVSDDERHILYTSNAGSDYDIYEAFR